MAKTLEELRADLGRFVGMFLGGTIDYGEIQLFTDRDGLGRARENNALNGSLVLVTGAGGAAPEDEWAYVEDYIGPDATELISNGSFEHPGAGGADVFSSWTETAGTCTITQDSGTVYHLQNALKIVTGAGAGATVAQTLTVTPGSAYRASLWFKGNYADAGQLVITDADSGEVIDQDTMTMGAAWTYHEMLFVVPDGTTSVVFTIDSAGVVASACYYDLCSLQKIGAVYLHNKLTATLDANDTYEVYLAPLSLEQWDQAINQAINAAWPQVFAKEIWQTVSAEVSEYLLPDAVGDILEVAVAFRDQYHGLPTESLPRHLWRVDGTPGTDLTLHLHVIVPENGRSLNVYYKAQYPELAAGESTELDAEYLMLAGAGRLYHILAAVSGPQASSGRYLQLLQYYDEQAARRRDLLEGDLLGLPIEARRERGSRKK